MSLEQVFEITGVIFFVVSTVAILLGMRGS